MPVAEILNAVEGPVVGIMLIACAAIAANMAAIEIGLYLTAPSSFACLATFLFTEHDVS